jgi:hypothetical protein
MTSEVEDVRDKEGAEPIECSIAVAAMHQPTGLPFTSEAQLSFCFSPTHLSLYLSLLTDKTTLFSFLQGLNTTMPNLTHSFGIYNSG